MATPSKYGDIVIPPKKTTKKESWETLVLRGLGAPVTEANVKFLRGWQAKEGTRAANNPLATTQGAAGATQFNSVGVKNYPDAQTGIDATIKTLQNGRYNGIVAAFKTGDIIAVANDPARSAALTQEFGVWSGNANNPAGARKYTSDVISLSGAPPRNLPSTPGAGEVFAEAGQSVADEQVRKSQSDPYVTTSGKLIYGSAPEDGIPSETGEPMRLSEFNRIGRDLNDTYYLYGGREASPAEIASFAANRRSIYALRKELAEKPEFTKSPIYQERAGDYISVYRETFGDSAKVPTSLVAKAVATGMNQGAFKEQLRTLPGYKNSTEFKSQASQYASVAREIFGPRYTPPAKVINDAVVAGLSADDFATQLRQSPQYESSNEFKQIYSGLYGAYSGIYGRPDDQGKTVVKSAAKQGWTADQFAQYLRSQPAYTQSPEYQAKSLSFLDAMGLITGGTAVLRDGMTAKNPETPLPGPGDPAVGPPAMGMPVKKGKTLRAQFAYQEGGAQLYG